MKAVAIHEFVVGIVAATRTRAMMIDEEGPPTLAVCR